MLHHRTWIFALVLGLVVSCGARQRPPPVARTLAFTYRVERTNPAENFELRVPARATARLALRRAPPGRPTSAVGFFGARVSDAQRRRLANLVDGHGLTSRHDEGELSAKGGGLLQLQDGGQSAEISLAATDAGARALRGELDGLVADALSHPVAALNSTASAFVDGAAVRVVTRFHASGTLPVEVAVTDEREPAAALQLRVVLERGSQLVDEQVIGASDTRRLAGEGKLPSGWHRLSARWDLPPVVLRLPDRPSEVFARVETRVRMRTRGREPLDVWLTSPSVSLTPE